MPYVKVRQNARWRRLSANFFMTVYRNLGLLIAGRKEGKKRIRCSGNKGENGCNSRVHHKHITDGILRWRREKLADFFTPLPSLFSPPLFSRPSAAIDVAVCVTRRTMEGRHFQSSRIAHFLLCVHQYFLRFLLLLFLFFPSQSHVRITLYLNNRFR